MTEAGKGIDNLRPVEEAPVGRHDGRKAGHQGTGVRGVVRGRKGCNGCADGVDDGTTFLRGIAQDVERGAGNRPAGGQFPFESAQRFAVREITVPQQMDSLFERRPFRVFPERESRDDQFASLAIDPAEPRLRGNDVLESG